MCTVSLIAPDRTFDVGGRSPLERIVFNRDERLDREIALPPRIVRGREAHSVMPVDASSHGTWIAANDAGLVFALLNGDPPGVVRAAPGPARIRSRGLIIPRLVEATSVDEVRGRLGQLLWRRYPAFRLFVFGGDRFLDVRPRIDSLAIVERPARNRFVATASSLRPREAARLRTRLFEGVVARPDAELQDIFHDERWRDCPELSVNMKRTDARTVSRTVVERFDDRIEMRYHALDLAGESTGPVSVVLKIPLARAGAA
jgi:hypothetical protein